VADPKDTLYRNGGIDRIRRIFPDDDSANVERPLWDSVAQEPARLSGVAIKIYSLRRAKNHHPLYREPSAGAQDWAYQGPWQMWATVDFAQGDDIDEDVGSEGSKRSATATIWLARKELEDAGSPDPKSGDVIEFWDLKPFAGALDGHFQFWDVTLANPNGNIMNTETFVQWKITVKSRTTFDARRKVEGTAI